MAGNRERYEAAMKAGNDATWDENWEKATQAFMAAVREFPDSVSACNSLGFALFQKGQLDDALKVYGQAHRLDPNDPLPLEKSADVFERMGRLNEAAKQHLAVADVYLAQHDIEKAIDNWERATRITPGMVKIHQRLAQAYERIGQRTEAVNQYLKLAYNFQQANNEQVALQALDRALRLAPKEPTVLNAITAVRNKKPLSPNIAVNIQAASGDAGFDIGLIDESIGDADERGPLGEAMESALEKLATQVFEGGMMDMAGASAIQAIEMHRAGITEEAISAYKRAEAAGMRQAPLFYNLGVLLLEQSRWEEASKYLQQVSGDPVISMGAAHGLALAFIGQEEWRKATKSLVGTLRLIDMSLALDDEEQAQLSDTYNRLNQLVGQATDETLKTLSQKFASRLTGVDWKRRVTQTRAQLEELISQGGDQNILEAVAQDDEVLDSMSRIDDYMSQRRFNLAMDEAHQVLQQSPDFLTAHLRIAQILMEMSHVETAISKYNLIAQTYLVRGDNHKAAEILNEIIKLAPTDIRLRENLINLLESQERWNDVLQQYIELARAYQELADTGSARTTYDQAIKLAQRTNAAPELVIEIMHDMAELDMDRLELRGALRSYQRISELAPEDVKARRKLVDLNYRLNNQVQATQELDKLLQIYAKQRKPDLIVEVLEEQTANFPNEMGLLSRLGGVYQQMNRGADALKQYEKLQHLQLDAGMRDEACKTIKRIVSLNPPNVGHYQQLLQQLGC